MRKLASTGLTGRYAWRGGGWILAGLVALVVTHGSPEVMAATIKEPAPVKSAASFEQRWKDLIQAAQAEGELVISTARGTTAEYDRLWRAFEQEFKIRTVISRGSGSDEIERLAAERAAGRYTVDIGFQSRGGAADRMLPAGMLDPIPPLLIHPEVANPSLWHQGKHWYGDPDQKYTFIMLASVRFDSVIPRYYNSHLVNEKELRGTVADPWSFFSERWRGKVGELGPPDDSMWLRLYWNPRLGPKFVTKFFTDFGVFFTADADMLADRLALGALHALYPGTGGIGSGIRKLRKLGLPVADHQDIYAEKASLMSTELSGSSSRANVQVINRRPHPNAAQLFLNWLLSKQGQTLVNKFDYDYGSLREDIPQNNNPDAKRALGVKYYLAEADPQYLKTIPETRKFIMGLYKARR